MSVSWPDVERTLCRIPHVTQARVVRDGDDRVRELHIVATTGKAAKQLVRDVQSVAMAGFGIDVDRHVVSIVQLDDEPVGRPQPPADQVEQRAPEAREGRARTQLSAMTVQSRRARCSLTVVLHWGAREAVGSADGAAGAVARLAAEATLAAVEQLHPEVGLGEIDGVEVRHVGAGRVALVQVAQQRSGVDDVLIGTANVHAAGEVDAVARAVLDAVNRRLPG